MAYGRNDGSKRLILTTRCLIPGGSDAKLGLKEDEASWVGFFIAAPGQRREFESNC
jgi:hypothetical protein